jgi:hypothetical protein
VNAKNKGVFVLFCFDRESHLFLYYSFVFFSLFEERHYEEREKEERERERDVNERISLPYVCLLGEVVCLFELFLL